MAATKPNRGIKERLANTSSPMSGLEQLLQTKGIIASVSLSHPQSCTCRVCLAAKGDKKALAEVIDGMKRGK